MTTYFLSGTCFGAVIIGLLAIVAIIHIEGNTAKKHRREMAQMNQWVWDAEAERDKWMSRAMAERLENKLRERSQRHGGDDPADAWKKS